MSPLTATAYTAVVLGYSCSWPSAHAQHNPQNAKSAKNVGLRFTLKFQFRRLCHFPALFARTFWTTKKADGSRWNSSRLYLKSKLEFRCPLCHSSSMEKDAVLAKLRAHQDELRAAGIVHLQLFGSVARGEDNAESDVDLLAHLDNARSFSLLGLIRLENRLADLLEAKVDLSPADSLKGTIRERANREAVLAF
jgi:uncharacterized protein